MLWLPPNTNRVRFVASVAQDDLPMVQTSDSSKQVFRLRLAPSKYVDYNSVLDRPGALPFGVPKKIDHLTSSVECVGFTIV